MMGGLCLSWQPAVTYPIEDRRPALHGNALEDGEHGKADVVERGDTCRKDPRYLKKSFYENRILFIP